MSRNHTPSVIDMQPREQRALFTTVGMLDFFIDEENQNLIRLSTRSTSELLRMPKADYFTAEQVEQLLLDADELSVRITHLNLGRETVWRYGHAGIAIKKNGKTLAHLDGFPAELVTHADGITEWVAVTNGKKQHMIKMFALTPESAAARTAFFGDHHTYENVGSIKLSHLSPARKQRAAARIRWAMEAINAADIPYIVPGLTVAEEIAHIMAKRAQRRDIVGRGAHGVLRSVLKDVHDLTVIPSDAEEMLRLIQMAGRRLRHAVAPIASLQSGHNIVAEVDVDPETGKQHRAFVPAGANSKNIFEAVGDLLEPDPRDPTFDPNEPTPRQQINKILDDFLAQPGFEDFRLPGGDSSLLHTVLWRHAPKAWEALRRERRDAELATRLRALQNVTTAAAAGTFVVVLLQSSTPAFAVESIRLAQQKISNSGDPVEAFKQVTATAHDASGSASQLASHNISWHSFLHQWPLAMGLAPSTLFYFLTPKPLRRWVPTPSILAEPKND